MRIRQLLVLVLLIGVASSKLQAQIRPEVVKAENVNRLVVSGETVATRSADIIRPRVLQFEGSKLKTTTWAERRDGKEVTMFAFRRPSGTWTQAKEADYRLKFRSGSFEPLSKEAPPFDERLMLPAIEPADADEKDNTYCVQFITQSLPEYQQAVNRLGCRVLDYVPNYCHVVSMKPNVAEQVRELPFVRWVGPYHPAFKLGKELLPPEARTLEAPTRFFVYTISRVDCKLASDQVKEVGGVLVGSTGGRLLVADLNTEQFDQVLRLPTVQAIEKWTPIEEDMDNARIQGGADFLETQATTPDGFTGVGIRGHVMEGINRNHPDFAANTHRQLPIVVDDGTSASHGQATFGIVFGSGDNDPERKARGMLPNAQGFFTHYRALTAPAGSTGPGSRYDLVRRLVNDHRVLFQTASWGNGRTTLYTAVSAEMDLIIFDHDVPITQSQSNAKNRMSRPQAWSKNVISVGGFAHFDNSNASDDSWQGGNASIGPAEDGRIKPDLSAYYDATRTTGITGYRNFGGTSGATPIIAGHLGLVIELWTDGAFGNELANPTGDRFDNRPHFTTAKALLIASAHQYDFNSSSTDNRREHQGWGFPNMRWLYEMRDKVFVVDETDPLELFDSRTYRLRVAPGEPLLKICMTYADPPGNPTDPPEEPERRNDLTLKATSPSGDVYWGNHGLTDGTVSVAGGAADARGTVECIFLRNPEGGQWTVEVFADELLQDARPETAEIDADFALVAIGIQRPKPPTLALRGKKSEFRLVENVGTVLYCLHGTNHLKRLEFYHENANHWYYAEGDLPVRRWAVARKPWSGSCCQTHAIWIHSPDIGINAWRFVDRAVVIGPSCQCKCSIR